MKGTRLLRSGYPTTASSSSTIPWGGDDGAEGEEQSLIIGIGNHEYRNVTYTVETILLNMTFDTSTHTSSVNAYRPPGPFTATLVQNETQEFPFNFTVNDRQFNRLQFLLMITW